MKSEIHNNAFPEIMTESELVEFLRIPAVSKAQDFHNVIRNLKRMRDLPCIHICRQPLYPREAVMKWVKEQTE
jgi:hypothetical protein